MSISLRLLVFIVKVSLSSVQNKGHMTDFTLILSSPDQNLLHIILCSQLLTVWIKFLRIVPPNTEVFFVQFGTMPEKQILARATGIQKEN